MKVIMKIYVVLFSTLLFLILSCRSSKQAYPPIKYERVLGKVKNIDSTNSSYIYEIEYGSNKIGVFLSSRFSCKIPKKYEPIKLGGIYSFYLSKLIYASPNRPFEIKEDEKLVWKSNSGKDYFEISKNTCGRFIWEVVGEK